MLLLFFLSALEGEPAAEPELAQGGGGGRKKKRRLFIGKHGEDLAAPEPVLPEAPEPIAPRSIPIPGFSTAIVEARIRRQEAEIQRLREIEEDDEEAVSLLLAYL